MSNIVPFGVVETFVTGAVVVPGQDAPRLFKLLLLKLLLGGKYGLALPGEVAVPVLGAGIDGAERG